MTASSVLPSPYPGPGEILDDKYRVERILGEGGMGAVARATHLLLHRTVAVKFMNPTFMSFPGAVERFLNEGRASGAIKSDHVVPVSDVGCLPSGTPYLVMECLEGLDLADLLARDGPTGLPVERAVHFVVQILRGLQAAHAIGIIHRDMKPSNCFVVNHDGVDDFVKILDFGISKIAQPGSASLTQTNSALGTPLYMSPEQARSPRDVDARSDLYSVGVILYELLSGRTPFFSDSGEFTEILFQLFTADPPPIQELRPDLPDALAAVVHKALAREVAERYESALELAEELVPFASEETASIVVRMRAFKPQKDSIIPAPDLPDSLAAFSQLQRSQGMDAPEAPQTKVQKGSPVTEILVDAGRLKSPIVQKTALLPQPVRPRAAEARAVTPPESPTEPAAGSAGRRRSPLVYALPAIVVLAALGGVALVARGRTADDARPEPSATTPTPSGLATPSAPGSTPTASASAAPLTSSASGTTSASTVAPAAPSASAPASATAAPRARLPATAPSTSPGLAHDPFGKGIQGAPRRTR